MYLCAYTGRVPSKEIDALEKWCERTSSSSWPLRAAVTLFFHPRHCELYYVVRKMYKSKYISWGLYLHAAFIQKSSNITRTTYEKIVQVCESVLNMHVLYTYIVMAHITSVLCTRAIQMLDDRVATVPGNESVWCQWFLWPRIRWLDASFRNC